MRLASELESDKALSRCNADAVKYTIEDYIDSNTISQDELSMLHDLTNVARGVENALKGVFSTESSRNVIPFDNSIL